jgi:hypothetical protein
MKNVNLRQERSLNSHPVTSFQGTNLTTKDLGLSSQVNARLGVIIDWSKGTMIVQANK